MFPKRKKAVRRAFPEPVAPEVTDESPFVDTEPEPEMFYAHASPEGRKTLTERDLARNAGVDRLFSLKGDIYGQTGIYRCQEQAKDRFHSDQSMNYRN